MLGKYMEFIENSKYFNKWNLSLTKKKCKSKVFDQTASDSSCNKFGTKKSFDGRCEKKNSKLLKFYTAHFETNIIFV